MAVQINKDKKYIYVIGCSTLKVFKWLKMKYLFDNKNESTQIKTNPL